MARKRDHRISAGNNNRRDHAGDAVAQAAQGDLTTAYNNAAAKPGGAILPADIGGQTLAPGVYKTTSAQPSLGITGNLTSQRSCDWSLDFPDRVHTDHGSDGNSEVIFSGGATVSERVLAGRQFGDPWNQHNIRRKHIWLRHPSRLTLARR